MTTEREKLLAFFDYVISEDVAPDLMGLTYIHPPEKVLPLLRAVAAARTRDLIERRHKLTGKPARRLLSVVGEAQDETRALPSTD
jgi:hypothetical protein